MGVVVIAIVKTKSKIEQPIEVLTKATDELTDEMKNFTLDELKASYEDGYVGDQTEKLKQNLDTALDDAANKLKGYFK